MLDRRRFLAAGSAALALASRTRALAEPADALDRAVRPGDDFYHYVNNAWLRSTTIPADQPGWNEFSRAAETNILRTRTILDAAARAPGDLAAAKLGDLYASLLDEAGIEALGIDPVRPDLARSASIAGVAELSRELARLSTETLIDPLNPMLPSPISTRLFWDIKSPTGWLPVVGQGGLGVPDRDYLIADTPAFGKVRDSYRAYLTELFTLADMVDPQARAARVLALETRIARTQWSRVEQRDLIKLYNLWTPAELAERAPGLDWSAFLKASGFAGRSPMLVAHPSAVIGAAATAASVPLADWRDYLAARTLARFAPVGPKPFADAHFAFAERALAGTPEMPARWKRAAALTDAVMGPAVGALYLARYFPPASRAVAVRLTGNIESAMRERLAANAWMAPATKARALTKLDAVRIDVGGEERARDYTALKIARGTAYANLLAAARFERARMVAKLDRPVDRGEWELLPHTVNAQSNPILVKIMFPAGIMQAPFFNASADAATNYGAIGVIMGHELSHIFDDQGSQFDEHGAFVDWWTPVDHARFAEAGRALIAQYNAYAPLPGVHVNGTLTLGENIGDLAGLALAYDAYRRSLNGRTPPVLGGLTGDQRFFVSFARTWRALVREPLLRKQLTGSHPPQEWRVAEVRNHDAWYVAFDVRPGETMYLPPAERVHIW